MSSSNRTSTALAFDLGATSGRAILGTLSPDGRLSIREVHRFPNTPVDSPQGLRWDAPGLRQALSTGLEHARSLAPQLDSVGVDTWGVDYALLDHQGELLSNPYHYRNPRTDRIFDSLVDRLGRDLIYRITGIQFLSINTLYQLRAAALDEPDLLGRAATFLTMPDLMHYWLTGGTARVCEYTNATTTQLLDCTARDWSTELFDAIGVPRSIAPPIVRPGTAIGQCGSAQVIAPATHDTGSAVAAVEASGGTAFLSSGTWSLLGTEVPHPIANEAARRLNFTNEGGVNGTIRLLKNITGLWLLEGCIKDWGAAAASYPQLVAAARAAAPFVTILNPDDQLFLHPPSMTGAIAEYCHRTGQPVPSTPGATVRAILEGLALRYRSVLEQLESLTGTPITQIRVIGGGSENELLNDFTASATGRRVLAGPKEATALGNLIVQFAGTGALGSIAEGRARIAESFIPRVFEPRDPAAWDAAYQRFPNV